VNATSPPGPRDQGALIAVVAALALATAAVLAPSAPADPNAPQHTLTVTKQTTSQGGHGTVTSDPAGIDCDANCMRASATLAHGAAVKLTATARRGSAFGGWTGACAGQGATCALVVSDDVTTTAKYQLATSPPPDKLPPRFVVKTPAKLAAHVGGVSLKVKTTGTRPAVVFGAKATLVFTTRERRTKRVLVQDRSPQVVRERVIYFSIPQRLRPAVLLAESEVLRDVRITATDPGTGGRQVYRRAQIKITR